jgi:hypothetical protein
VPIPLFPTQLVLVKYRNQPSVYAHFLSCVYALFFLLMLMKEPVLRRPASMYLYGGFDHTQFERPAHERQLLMSEKNTHKR